MEWKSGNIHIHSSSIGIFMHVIDSVAEAAAAGLRRRRLLCITNYVSSNPTVKVSSSIYNGPESADLAVPVFCLFRNYLFFYLQEVVAKKE